MKGFLRNKITTRPARQSVFFRALVTAIVALQLAACGGGSSTGESAAVNTSTNERIAPAGVNTGSVSLEWTAPVTRADGTPLSLADIGGFYIYYGKSEGSYSNRINLDDGTAQAATLNDIPVGTYYMVMTTYDVNGHESSYSPAVKKTVL